MSNNLFQKRNKYIMARPIGFGCLFKFACEKGDVLIIDFILNLPANVITYSTQDGQRGFLKAIEHGHIEIVKMLSNIISPKHRLINISFNENEPIMTAIRTNQPKILEYLLSFFPKRGINPADRDNDFIAIAAEVGNTETMEILLKYSRYNYKLHTNVEKYLCKPNANDNEALRRAAEYGNLEVLKLLLDYLVKLPKEEKVFFNFHLQRAFEWAIGSKRCNIVSFFIHKIPYFDHKYNNFQALDVAEYHGGVMSKFLENDGSSSLYESM